MSTKDKKILSPSVCLNWTLFKNVLFNKILKSEF